jgi:hypothetical protein
VSPHFLALSAVPFGRAVTVVAGAQHGGIGAVEVAPSDVKGDVKKLQWRGTAKETGEDVVDARWDACDPSSANDVARALARCLCELAIFFRDTSGGVILDLEDEIKMIEPRLA